MVGHKLFSLIKELNTSERKLLYYKAKKSSDKRQKQFQLLLGEKEQSTYDFQNNLEKIKEQLSSKQNSEKVKHDQLRRFVDFCIKEIEDLKIDLYTKQSQKIRHYILSDVYNKTTTRNIYEDYLSKLNTNTKDTNDYWLQSYFLNKMSSLKLLSQTDQDFMEWRKLVASQIQLLQKFYHAELASVYEKIASSYVDDRNSLDHFDHSYLKEEYILKQIELISDLKVKSTLYLALARFNIDDEIKYPMYSSESLRIIKNIHDKEADMIRRKVFFASFLHTFHFNHPYHIIKKLLLKIIDLNEKNQVEEPKMFFYLFLLQIINHDGDGKINIYYGNHKKHFTEDHSIYFYHFLEAVEYYKNQDFKSTKRILHQLSFINNPYIASWSRCLEIATNYKQGDFDLAESLVVKEMKRLSGLSHRFFTINSSAAFTINMSKLLNIKAPKTLIELASRKSKLSPIHQFILDSINNS